jgi:hypothetical protein
MSCEGCASEVFTLRETDKKENDDCNIGLICNFTY